MTRANKVIQVLKVHQVLKAELDHPELMEDLDLRETWDHLDSLDQRVVMVFLADPACPDHPVLSVNPEKMESRERLDHQERKGLRDQKVPWDHKDHQE